MNKYKTIRVLTLIVAITLLGFGFWLGRKIPFSQQWPQFEALRTTASIIFAVVGAWLAIIYPERLKFTFSASRKNNKVPPPVNMSKLLNPVIHSTGILCIVLMIGITAPLLKQVPYLLPFKESLRGVSYFTLMLLTFWQLWTVLLTLIPADFIISRSNKENKQREFTDSFFKNATEATQQSDIENK